MRLWDWRAFHDTITQIQALRQYYVFADTDVDRYMHRRQYAPGDAVAARARHPPIARRARELDQRPLHLHARLRAGDGRGESHHPAGPAGAADPGRSARVKTQSLKLTRPEIYYGETVHEPVFVRTAQPEFNYPSGSENVQTQYEGKGGIPDQQLRDAAGRRARLHRSQHPADRLLNPESRMMIHRDVRERLAKLASFIDWDPDPYLVVTDEGRLVWMVDGYTSSWRTPTRGRMRIGDIGHGQLHPQLRKADRRCLRRHGRRSTSSIHPIRSFGRCKASSRRCSSRPPRCPPDLRAHARYPGVALPRARRDLPDVPHARSGSVLQSRRSLGLRARTCPGKTTAAKPCSRSTSLAVVPGSSKPEFLLLQPFTPRSKDNLIGVMVARCDGENLGEMLVLQLSKQSLIFGPMQIEARINSDQNIAKDLSLWNQQGSQVLRGQMLVLPIEDTFPLRRADLHSVAQAKMPQLKKVVLAMGNTLSIAIPTSRRWQT